MPDRQTDKKCRQTHHRIQHFGFSFGMTLGCCEEKNLLIEPIDVITSFKKK